MKIAIVGLFVLFAVVSCDDTTPVPSSTGAPESSTTTTPAKPTEAPVTTAATTASPSPPTPTPAPAPVTTEPTPAKPVYPSDDSKFPEPVVFNVSIANSNHTCLNVKLAAQFVVSNGTRFLKLEGASRSDESTCKSENDTEITLALTFGGNNVSFVFKRDEALTSAWLDTIHLAYHSDNETVKKWDLTEKLFESNGTSTNGKQYHCRGEVATETSSGVKVVFKQIEVQVGSGEHGVDLTSCPADEDVNDMIPIAVGAALLALVAIVLVAYFVGRRRSRRLAYQSV